MAEAGQGFRPLPIVAGHRAPKWVSPMAKACGAFGTRVLNPVRATGSFGKNYFSHIFVLRG